jgi:hypothetical protein
LTTWLDSSLVQKSRRPFNCHRNSRPSNCRAEGIHVCHGRQITPARRMYMLGNIYLYTAVDNCLKHMLWTASYTSIYLLIVANRNHHCYPFISTHGNSRFPLENWIEYFNINITSCLYFPCILSYSQTALDYLFDVHVAVRDRPSCPVAKTIGGVSILLSVTTRFFFRRGNPLKR